MMRTIAVINQKGGCGKTTTAINLGACLAFRGRKVLIVDLDPQAHATLGLGFMPGSFPRSVYDILAGKASADDVIVPMADKLHLIPSDVMLSAAEPLLLGRDGREYRLADALAPLADTYDFVIIDCPPNIGVLTFNALFACNEAIIPMETGLFALHGLTRLMETIEVVNAKRGARIKAAGLLTMFDRRTKIARESLNEIQKHLGGQVFGTVINLNVRLKEAAGHGQPIIAYDPGSMGAHDYLELAGEILRVKAKGRQTADRPGQVRTAGSGRQVQFSLYAPEAEQVYVVADFNDWTVGQARMKAVKNRGVWKLNVPLKKGRYEYKFFVDGAWMTDPGNPRTASTEFGENSLIEVD